MEDGSTFFENALKKARATAVATGEIALADDSGLEVEYLNGEPGIFSARYAGPEQNDRLNIEKLLKKLDGIPFERRNAAFRCVLVLYRPDGSYETFEGRWRGVIYDRPLGEGGFGYDPVFYLPELGVTVAQLQPDEKNRMSHRAIASAKLKEFIKTHPDLS